MMRTSSAPAGKDQPQGEPEAKGFVFTKAAIAQTLLLAQEEPHRQFSALRIYLAGKICDGFTYGVQFDEPLTTDHCFALRAGEHGQEFAAAAGPVPQVICDQESYPFLRGSTIDYVDDERGRGYLVTNPHHTDYAGKFYKDPAWQAELTQRLGA